MKWSPWTRVVLATSALLLLSGGGARAEEEADEEKEAFVPIKFVEPKLSSTEGVYLWEYFKGRGAIGKTWIKSRAKKDGVDSEISKYNGEWDIATPSEVSIDGDYSLVVKTDARHHAISSKLSRPFVFGDKPLVLQYEVRYEEGQNCGGGYVKLLSEGIEKNLEEFNDKTPYTVMFGPDKCAPSGKVHLIFRYKNPVNGEISEHAAKQPDIASTYWDDHKSHLYTLVVRPDGYYSVSVDYKQLYAGSMLKDLLPPIEPAKEINDPEDKKPEDWDDRAEIEDETAIKPDDWDENAPREIVDETAEKPSDWIEDEQSLIPDPRAVKPDDWDTDMDGEWEPPMIENEKCKGVSGCGEWKKPLIKNPEYKGKWRRPKIPNPAFKGVWAPRVIPNPAHYEPTPFGGLAPITALGIELWTMSKNILFDNLLIADSEDIGTEAARLTFDIRKAEESRLKASKGEGGGILSGLIEATEDKPWLWAVYVLAVIIPIIIIAIFCFGRKGDAEADVGYRKKHDISGEDDEQAPNLVNDEGEEVVEEAESAEDIADRLTNELEKKRSSSRNRRSSGDRASASPAKGKAAKKSVREEIEDGDSSEEGEEAAKEEEEEEEEEFQTVQKKGAAKKGRRPKKAE